MASADPPACVSVLVVLPLGPHRLDSTALQLPAGATLADAVRHSGLLQRHGAALMDSLATGIWGKPAAPDTLLRYGDRVELARPLLVDPKEARRQRYRRDGVKPRR
jgi:putative ubiquitin-RnfH superfamily antitoxin RatB of RatAB toxin-antitoxin module